LLLGKLRLIIMGLLRKVSKGPLGVPSQQSVHARAKKCIKETASLTSQNVFAISIFIKHVKECDHKAFQGLTALVFWLFCFIYLFIFKLWQQPSSQCAVVLSYLSMWRMVLENCSEWQVVFSKCLITPCNWSGLMFWETTSILACFLWPKAWNEFSLVSVNIIL